MDSFDLVRDHRPEVVQQMLRLGRLARVQRLQRSHAQSKM